MRGIKAEFGYDDRIGVGACDRGPSGLGRRELGATEKTVALLAFVDAKALACDRGPAPTFPGLGQFTMLTPWGMTILETRSRE